MNDEHKELEFLINETNIIDQKYRDIFEAWINEYSNIDFGSFVLKNFPDKYHEIKNEYQKLKKLSSNEQQRIL